jgi:adenine-specific DNA-methyltransferase
LIADFNVSKRELTMAQQVFPFVSVLNSEAELATAALALGAKSVVGWSGAELSLVQQSVLVDPAIVAKFEREIQWQEDPLGDAFRQLRSPAQRRERGAIYTPQPIVKAMIEWAATQGTPARVVDPGVGSGRFLIAAGRRFPGAELIGIEIDPLAALTARGHLAAAGLAGRSQVRVEDYRATNLARIQGKTLFLGNPPYVRHHLLGAQWKQWLTERAFRLGYDASQLAGLHVHFFLATVLQASKGDYGCFITSAEWLDVNYGQLVRDLFLGKLGGHGITVIEPTAQPFADAASTAAITFFEIGSKARSVRMRRAETADGLGPLNSDRLVHRGRLESQARWSHLTRRTKTAPAGYVELGEICRVHRGQVTGANCVWISGEHSRELPRTVLFASVTKAKELFTAGRALTDPTVLRQVIDLPVDLSALDPEARKMVERFLQFAKAAGADRGYVAKNRKAWWAVGLRSPAPILATYMARRPPAFVRNLAEARHINIAHGLYPREPLETSVLDTLAFFLARATRVEQGRTYAGGLTKFEPREMERLLVPSPDVLRQGYLVV